MSAILEKLLSRKFLLVLYITVASTLLLHYDSLDKDTFKQINAIVMVFYIGGNVAQKAIIKPTVPSAAALATTAAPSLTSTVASTNQTISGQ